MRPLLVLALATSLATPALGEEAPGVREMVDRLKDLEAQIALIERESALPTERSALWAGAARGLVEAADPHGGYLGPDEVAIYGLGNEPQRIGCGFDWRQGGDGRVRVTRVVRGSPAAQAGLHPGAEIVGVNALEPAKASRREVAEALARSGDAVQLRVLLAGAAAPTAVTLKRIELDDDGIAASAMAGEAVAVIRIGRFMPAAEGQDATATAAGLRAALAALPKARAVVLDLRGCAGGNLQAAVEIAAGWAPPGAVIAEQRGRDPARSRQLRAEVPPLPDLSLVLVVDGGTASAAEVLAHALRHHRKAPVVGAQTLGKGTVQQIFLLPRGDAIRLTVARLASPAGLPLDQGLKPDVAVAQDEAITARRLAWEATPTGAGAPPPDPQLERAIDAAQALIAGR